MKFNFNGSVNPNNLNRDEFLIPFDRIFDKLMDEAFPTFKEEVGVSFNKGAYPKVNIYEYDDKIGIVAEIPGLDKKNVTVDVDVLIDDSPEKLDIFKDRSVAYGNSICYRQSWNQDSQKKYMTIDRLSDIMTRVFG